MDEETAGAVGRAAMKVAKAIVKVTGDTDYNLILNNGPRAGQEVWHSHFHIVPRVLNDGLRLNWKVGGGGAGYLVQDISWG